MKLTPLKNAQALNQPVPVEVRTDRDGNPTHYLNRHSAWVEVTVRDRWRVDDRWWREHDQVSRMYYELVTPDGDFVTVFQDRIGNAGYSQRYSGLPGQHPSTPGDRLSGSRFD